LSWDKFKNFYQEHLKNILDKDKAQKPEELTCINQAEYSVKIKGNFAEVDVLLKGSMLSGQARRLKLFDNQVTVAQVGKRTRAEIFSDSKGIFLRPLVNDKERDFELALRLLIPVGEDKESCFAGFNIPLSLSNMLKVTLPANCELYTPPGIPGDNGVYFLRSAPELRIRFEKKSAIAAVPEIDMFSSFELRRERLLMNVVLKPRTPLSRSFTLKLPAGARLLSTDLKKPWLKAGKDELTIQLPPGSQFPMELNFLLESGKPDALKLRLPRIVGNTGREGDFNFHEPYNAELDISGDALVKNIPVGRLREEFGRKAIAGDLYMNMPVDNPLSVTIRRFGQVVVPDTVLDSISFFTAFEENGNALSVLSFELPAGKRRHLFLKQIPDADIWYLKINGNPAKVFSNDSGNWVISLPQDTKANIELAYLRRSSKLGLAGKAEAVMPSTGLKARKLYYGIALPERLDLITTEGAVSPMPAAQSKGLAVPKEFAGHRYYFYRAFYKGDEIKLSFSYREPAK
jgi:hypothetical protein